MNPRTKAKLKQIKLLIMDVDGVMTDGKIVLDDQGREIKFFNVLDGFGIVLWRKAGLKSAILSARAASSVAARAKDLQIDRVCQDAFPKIKAYAQLLEEFGVNDAQVCFMGDDLPDVEVLGRVGFAVAVANATPEAMAAADYVTQKPGGNGAIREIIEMILKAQGHWDGLARAYGVR